MATTNYGWTLPTVGGSEDTWGDENNTLWTDLDTLLGGVNATEFAILDGATVTTAELNKLDGVTVTTAEINYLAGVTSAIQTQIDGKAANTTQDTTTWEDGTGTTESIVSPAKVKAAVEANAQVVANNVKLTSGQVEDDTSTDFGTVSGERLNQSIESNLNVTGSAPMYACRAWVNFDGTGTVAIRASGNVSSITDNGTGDYTVNFTTAMPDADYSVQVLGGRGDGTTDIGAMICSDAASNLLTSSVRVCFESFNTNRRDVSVACVNIFR